MWGGGGGGGDKRLKKGPSVDRKSKRERKKKRGQREGGRATKKMMKMRKGRRLDASTNHSLLSSSSYSLLTLLPLQPLFNSPHPLIPSHGVAKRIMGNEMAYLLLPRGEIEKERKKKSQRQNKKRAGKTEFVNECLSEKERQMFKERCFLLFFFSSICHTNNRLLNLNILSLPVAIIKSKRKNKKKRFMTSNFWVQRRWWGK